MKQQRINYKQLHNKELYYKPNSYISLKQIITNVKYKTSDLDKWNHFINNLQYYIVFTIKDMKSKLHKEFIS